MKKALFILAALSLLCASCAKKNVFSGHLDNLGGDSLKVEIFDIANQRTPIKTMVIPAVGGDFTCEIVDTTVRGMLIVDPATDKTAHLVYVPGQYAKIGGRLDSLVILGGSEYYTEQKEFEALCADENAKMMGIANAYRAIAADDPEADAKRDSLMADYETLGKLLTDKSKQFALDHASGLFAPTILSRLIGEDGKDALEVLELIPDDVKQGVMKVYVDQATQRANHAKARAEAAEKVKDGMAAPDFTLKNEKGEDFTLSSIYNQGKYIILDFWGEWCYWCKKGIPDMKSLYKDAKGKIEILSIDCNDTEEVWKKAIKDHDLPWLHVYNPGDETIDVSTTYAIQGYPTKVILNPDGTINKTVIGEDPEFYTYVKSLIGKK